MHDFLTLPVAAARSETRPGLILQRLPLAREVALRDLYLRIPRRAGPAACRVEDGALRIARGTAVSFDTYFGAFFEQAWRGPTDLRSLVVDIEARGGFALRVIRRSAAGEETLLHEVRHRRFDGRLSIPLRAPLLPAGGGRLFAELTATRDCVVEALEWRTPDTPHDSEVGLVPVFCTFGREEQLAAVLRSFAAEPDCWQGLPAIVVVNQGRPGLAEHPAFTALPRRFAARLRIVEQGNFGGAGGFTRGMLEARTVPGATHILLMDDDVAAEPEAVRRTVAFFTIARPRQVLGGHMLDMLRPTHLYEAGAQVDHGRLALRPLKLGLKLAERRTLDALIRPEPMHYNGWWYFALPIPLLEEAGLPLPCFIRGDDVEYGLRLHGLGAPIVTMPGVAIWHEPFYVKLNGWQLYYEVRNMLAAAAVHMPTPPRRLAVLLLKQFLLHLLTYRYYGAALVLRAVEDYLQGPAVLEGHPGAIHAALNDDRAAFPPEKLPPGQVVEPAPPVRDLRGLADALARLAGALLRGGLRPARGGAPRRVAAHDLVWFRVTGVEAVAVDTGWDACLPVFRRSPSAFRALVSRAIPLLRRVLREGDAVADAWRESHHRLTSTAFWQDYLGQASSGGRRRGGA
jgi:galactofuranosylgalactofuranosylrhamnosyl-N-acetylglucosaminyl-diphospho-decaprenol beta-1,5/1,6-galactofuranosyltransferase